MIGYLRYAPDVEGIGPDEAETFAKIAETFKSTGEKVAEKEGRRLRVSHAKPTALLDGELIVEEGLPPELAQRLAALPGRYAAQIRFAQGPGELLDDKISTHRGMAVKLTSLLGDSIPEAAELQTQDFVLDGTGRAFINSTANSCRARQCSADVAGARTRRRAPNMPQPVAPLISKRRSASAWVSH